MPGVPADTKPLPVQRAGGDRRRHHGRRHRHVRGQFRHAGDDGRDQRRRRWRRAWAAADANWQRTVDSGRLRPEEMERRAALLKGSTDFEGAVREADLVIEAVFEDMAVKKEVFGRLDKAARPGIVLASNTSTLDIDEIASRHEAARAGLRDALLQPGQRHAAAGDRARARSRARPTIATAMDVGKRIGKLNVRGRQLRRLRRQPHDRQARPAGGEAAAGRRLPQDIDRVMEGYGMAMGPLATGDLAGLDIGAAVRKARGTVAPIADAIVAAGPLRPEDRRRLLPLRREPQAPAGPGGGGASSSRSPRRCRCAAARSRTRRSWSGCCCRWSTRARASWRRASPPAPIDIDVIFTSGFGWPAWRGGPMFWADRMGLKQVRDKLAHYAEATNDPNLQPGAADRDAGRRGRQLRRHEGAGQGRLTRRPQPEENAMDLRFTDAEIAFRKEVRDFIARELPAETRERMIAGKSPDQGHGRGLAAQAERQGLGGARMAGGMAAGRAGRSAQRYIFREELQQAPAPQPLAFNINMCGPVIIAFGTEEQKKRFLPRMAEPRRLVVPGLLRARRRLRPRRPQDAGGARGRPLRGQRPEDLDHAGAARRLDLPAGPHRPEREEAGGHLLPAWPT